MKNLIIAVVMIFGLCMVSEAQATNQNQRNQQRQGLISRLLQGRNDAQRANNFQRIVVDNRGRQLIIVDNHGRQVIQRNVFVQQQRNLRVVEVPNLNVRSNLIVVRDRFGRVVDVQRQNVIGVQQFRSNQSGRIIIQQSIIRR